MNPNIISRNVRVSPVALALVLLVLLGALTLRAEAQEPTGEGADAPPVPTLFQKSQEERRALYEENQAQRAEFREQVVEEREQLRTTDATPEQMEELRIQVREERADMLDEQRAEVRAWRETARADVRQALEQKRTDLHSRVEERRAERTENAEERRAQLNEAAQERLGSLALSMVERMYRALDQLTSIADRIESRIAKIEEKHGVDLSTASDLLDEARSLIEEARGDVTELGDLADEALSSEDPKGYLEEVRAAASIAKESIKAVHQALTDTVIEVRASLPTQDDEEAEEENAEESSTE